MSEFRFGLPPASDLDVNPTPEEVEFYAENGYLVVERITTDEEIEWLTKVFMAVFDEPSPATFEPGKEKDQVGPPQILQSLMPEMRFPELLHTTYYRNAKKYAAALMKLPEDDLRMWGHMLMKPPRKSRPAPWHQDEAYWEPEYDYNAIAAWLPLHDVSIERGCMQFIPGSNNGEVLTHGYVGDPAGNLLIAEGVDETKAAPCELQQGACTFHHPRTLHYTAPNTTDEPRLAFPMEFQLPPRRRVVPADNRPWVVTRREVLKLSAPEQYPADGKFVPIPA